MDRRGIIARVIRDHSSTYATSGRPPILPSRFVLKLKATRESAAPESFRRITAVDQLPCRGDNGCKRDGDVIRCDMTKNVAGDACASTAENKGLCTADQTAVLTCRDGVLVHTSDCKTCAVSGDQVVCQP